MSQLDPSFALENKPIGPLLLQYSIPAIIGMTISSLYNIISSIFIGHGVGPLALSAMAVNFPLFNLLMAVCMLVAVGGATVCSIELGRKNEEGACLVLGQVVVLDLILSVVFSAVCLFFLDPVLLMFGASAETLPYARDYMEVMLLLSPVGFTMLALNSLMRASGYPTKAMITAMVSVAVSVVLSPLFIFVFKWGMHGAALATVVAQLISGIWILCHFFHKNSLVRFRPGIFRLRKSVASSILAVGTAPFLMNACACLVVIIINHSLYRYAGDLAIGAYGIMNRVLMLFAMVVMGLTQGMQPIIGYNFGARKPWRVRLTMIYGIAFGSIVTITGTLCFECIPGLLARMFTDHPQLIELSVTSLRLSGAAFFVVGAQIVITAYFQSIGRAKIAIFLSLGRQLLFLVPCLLILPPLWGLNGVWCSMPASDLLAFLVGVTLLWQDRSFRGMKGAGDPSGKSRSGQASSKV